MNARRTIANSIPALMLIGTLAACGVPGFATPRAVPAAAPAVTTVPTSTAAAPAIAPPPQTVYVTTPAPHTVYVHAADGTSAQSQWYAQQSWIDSQSWIDITPGPGQTDCQWLFANGYSYPQAFAAWAQNGYPANWSATGDGYPCQRSYGMQH